MRGWAELTLLVAVCAACWTRTPVSAVAQAALALHRDEPTPDLLAAFRTELPRTLQRSIDRALLASAPSNPADPDLEGWSPALGAAVEAHLGATAWTELQALARVSEGEAPEQVLERWALGEGVVLRATDRARAAGASEPWRLSTHRRFLSDASAAEADRAVSQTLALATVLDLSWPVDAEARISSGFGYRVHPTLKTRKLHEGVDIAVPIGTPVHAAGPGRVSRSTQSPVSGRYVVLDHGHGVSTAYCHGETLHVGAGTPVDRGHHLMDSGNTGRSTGPHLHFGLRIDGRPVDPQALLRAPALSDAGTVRESNTVRSITAR